MIIFSTVFKILNKLKGNLILYTVILLAITLFNTTSGNMNHYEATKPDILIVNKDQNNEITKGFVSYLKEQATLKDIDINDQEKVDDALFYRDISYVVYIPENFGGDLVNDKNPTIEYKSNGNENASFTQMLIEKYTLLKERLGKVPSIVDFYVQGEVDPLLFIQYAGSYPKFLQMAEKNCALNLSDKEHMTLEFVSQNIVNGKRIYELLLLRQLMQDGRIDKEKLTEYLQREYCVKLSDQSYESAISVLQGHFFNTQTEKKKYEKLDILVMNNTGAFSRMLSLYSGIKKSDFLNQLNDLIELGVKRYTDLYLPLQDELGLSLYQKYSRKDVCRILNWEQDESSTIYGYKIKYNTCPIFVTYEKKDDIASSTKYEDEFINNQVFSWMTRSRVSADSIESRKLIASSDSGLKILLFVKKSDGEGTDFYYMGRVHPIAWEQKEIYNDKGIALPIMNFRLKLEHSVREDIYQYFVCT